MKLAAAAASVLALAAVGYRHWRAAQTQGRLSAIAAQVAGRPVRVHCKSLVSALVDVSGELGSVRFDAHGRPSDTTTLQHEICTRLARFPHSHHEVDCLLAVDLTTLSFASDQPPFPPGCSRSTLDTDQAVETLAHESFHLHGYRAEAAAECYGVQETAFVAERLHATPDEARALARYALLLMPLKPTEYVSSECHA